VGPRAEGDRPGHEDRYDQTGMTRPANENFAGAIGAPVAGGRHAGAARRQAPAWLLQGERPVA
jgi:hypothetical protein